MRKYLVPILLLILTIHASFQCNECVDRPSTQLDDSRNWFPLKGKTAIDFVSSNGTIRTVSVRVVDTTYSLEQCVSRGTYYSKEKIDVQLILDTTSSSYQYIGFYLGNVYDLYVQGTSDTTLPYPNYDRWYNVFSRAGKDMYVIALNNYRLNNTTYPRVIILKSAFLNPMLDSIILARNYGIAGFKYKGVRYALP
jgi:hypothetical protein